MREIRIYYGALEQADRLVRPVVEACAQDAEIKMIRLSQFRKKSPLNAVMSVLRWKAPDILITAVDGGAEDALFLVELSTAVFTKDHELQRFDIHVPSMERDVITVKISTSGKRTEGHGGDKDFDYKKAYALLLEKTGRLAYHFEWPVDGGNAVLDPACMSCPPPVPGFTKLVCNGIREYFRGREGWIERTHGSDGEFREWADLVRSTPLEDPDPLQSSRTWYEGGVLDFKFNRMGHAMDPERGMLVYYGLLVGNVNAQLKFDKDKNAWYGGTARASDIEKYVGETGLAEPADFLKCFLVGMGAEDKLGSAVGEDRADWGRRYYPTFDITDELKEHAADMSKPLRIMFGFSDSLELLDGGSHIRARLEYGRMPPAAQENPDRSITPLKEMTLTEDEVTYAVVHNVLKANKFKIIAVSYPAAMGDRVMLVERGKGRAQRREYIDAVFVAGGAAGLHESKGRFDSRIRRDVDKLARYRDRKGVVDEFMEKYGCGERAGRIVVGVGFAAPDSFTADRARALDELDYFVYVNSDSMKWSVWECGGAKLFTEARGKVEIPAAYNM